MTAVDGGEPEIEVTFLFIWEMFQMPGPVMTETLFLYRWTMIQVLMVALMWQEHRCSSPYQGATSHKSEIPSRFILCFNFCHLRIGNHCIVDSSPEEESCSSASLVVAVTPDGAISTLRKVTNNHSWWDTRHTEEGFWDLTVVLHIFINGSPLIWISDFISFFCNIIS